METELYELFIHFQNIAGKDLMLQRIGEFRTPEDAIDRAQAIADAFVLPSPDFWYIEDAPGFNVWTDYPEPVAKVVFFRNQARPPKMHPITDKEDII